MNSIIYPTKLQKIPIRLFAGFVWFISSLALIIFFYNTTISFLLSILLFYEFCVTFFGFFQFSFLKVLSDTIWAWLFLKKEDWIYYKPKRFAKFCGSLILLFSIVFYFYSSILYFLFLTILAVFSFLEAVFDFCVACKIYYLLQRWRLIPEDSCRDCK